MESVQLGFQKINVGFVFPDKGCMGQHGSALLVQKKPVMTFQSFNQGIIQGNDTLCGIRLSVAHGTLDVIC